jgi:hypothetical protein
MPARITVLLRDGRDVDIEKNDYQGFWRTRALGWDGALEKFDRLTAPVLDKGVREAIPQAVQSLDTIPVRELAELLGSRSS